jgi:phytol kinase
MSWGVVIYASIFLFQFFVLEVLKRSLGLKAEFTRKVIHLVSGVTVASMPWFIEGTGIIILSASFVLLLILSKQFGLFSSIHAVKRKTMGEFAFAASAGLAAILLLPNEPGAFSFGFLILAFSDTAAELIGSWRPWRKFTVFGSTKSLGGSSAFLLVSASVCLAWGFIFGLELNYAGALGVILGLTLLEFVQPYGLDDLSLPVISGLLYPYIFQ